MAFTDTAERRPQQTDPAAWVGGAQAMLSTAGADRDRWKFRRMMIFGVVILLCAVLIMLAVMGDGDKFGNTVWAIVSLVGIYIGAPVADDWLQTRQPRAA